jgi:hypothetical protein
MVSASRLHSQLGVCLIDAERRIPFPESVHHFQGDVTLGRGGRPEIGRTEALAR